MRGYGSTNGRFRISARSGESWYVRATNDGSDSSLEFRLLGPLEVVRDGREVALGGRRQRSVLAVLLVRANEIVSSDRLIDEVWGGEPPETAATALHGIVSQLRKALEPARPAGSPGAVLVTRSPGYVLRADRATIDSARFEQLLTEGRATLDAGEAGRAASSLRDALLLWRGRALDGADQAPTAHAEAMRLEELKLEALEERIDADLALGRDEELVPELEGLVEQEPLRERLQAQLMLALYRAGRQADALALYQGARTTLRDRLGIEPSQRLRELEQAMLRQDPELDEGLPRVRPRRVLRRRRKALAVAAVVGVLLVVAAAAAFALTRPDAPLAATPGSVAVVDTETGRVVDTIEVGADPVAIVSGHGSIWVANYDDDTVSRIDPATREVVRVIGVSSPVDLAVGPGAIWVAGGLDGIVSRIDVEANDVVAEIELPGPGSFVSQTVHGVAATSGGVWAAVSGGDLVRIDSADNRPAGSIETGSDQLAVAAGEGALWVVRPGRLLRIQPATAVITARLPVGSGFAHDVVTGDDGVHVLSDDIWIIDPRSATLRRTLSAGAYVTALADSPGPGLWAATYDGMLVHFTDTQSAEPPTKIFVGERPSGIVVDEGAVWVAIGDAEY